MYFLTVLLIRENLMNSIEAKKIPICTYLSINADKNEFFIKSPFSPNEKTPSFKINQIKNIWYDHARGEGGNILDLVMKLNNCTLSQALQLLDSNNFSFSPASIKSYVVKDKQESKIEIKKIQDLQNSNLITYICRDRKIDENVAKKYLKEIYYSKNNKNYFSLAFQNDSEGYETRNAYFKGCIGHKDITTIKGTQNNKLSIFEGFMDFLSALTHYKMTSFKNNVIILNSVSNKVKIEDLLYSDLYNKIYLFLDNDSAGEETKQHFYNINQNCIDCSNLYKKNKDFNEFLQKR